MGLTARFKNFADSLYFIVEESNTDFTGVRTTRRIILPKPEVDFAIDNFIEYKYHYDLIVQEKNPNICDGGESIKIINIPKDMITIANKHLMDIKKWENLNLGFGQKIEKCLLCAEPEIGTIESGTVIFDRGVFWCNYPLYEVVPHDWNCTIIGNIFKNLDRCI